jgi:hypothetical protein
VECALEDDHAIEISPANCYIYIYIYVCVCVCVCVRSCARAFVFVRAWLCCILIFDELDLMYQCIMLLKSV